MSFLDNLTKLFGSSKVNEKKIEEKAIISLEKAAKHMDSSIEKQVESIYPQCKDLCDSIIVEATTATESAVALGEKQIDSTHFHYRIGAQMQKNFVERVPSALAAIKRPENESYQSFMKFYSDSLAAVKTIVKINNDNRYLLMFFDSELGSFGKRMNEIVRLTEELRLALDTKKDLVEKMDKVRSLQSELRELSLRTSSFLELKKEISTRNSDIQEKIKSAAKANEGVEKEIAEIRTRIEDLNRMISVDKKAITDNLSPFQRQFRKLQKRIIEKDISQSLAKYIEEPESMLVSEIKSSGGYPMLKRILTDMAKLLEKGELETEEKIRMRRLDLISNILNGDLIDPAKRLVELETTLSTEQDALSKVSRNKIDITALQHESEQSARQLAKVENDESDSKKRIETDLASLESLLKEITGSSAKISLTV